jgi:hypothetical protein
LRPGAIGEPRLLCPISSLPESAPVPYLAAGARPIERIQSAAQPSRLPGERPGSISGMGTALRRCGRIFDASICLRHLMKSAGWVYVGYQIDNHIMLLYKLRPCGSSSHIALKPISNRRNTGCGAVPSFAEPAPAQDFRQSPISSADNFLQKQQKQRGGLWCRSRRDALPAPPGPLARSMARQQHRRTDVAVGVLRGRKARRRAGDGDEAICYLHEKFCRSRWRHRSSSAQLKGVPGEAAECVLAPPAGYGSGCSRISRRRRSSAAP